MRILAYIGNVVTGRFAHWNTANNQLIADLWERSNQFPEPIKAPFQDFIVSCSSLTSVLLGPDEGRQRMIEKDPLQVTRQQFARIHAILLESLVGMFLQLHPSLSEPFKGALTILTGRNPDQSRMIQLTESLDEPDVMVIGCAAWEEIVQAAKSSQGTTARDAYLFAMALGTAAVARSSGV